MTVAVCDGFDAELLLAAMQDPPFLFSFVRSRSFRFPLIRQFLCLSDLGRCHLFFE